MWQMLIIKKLTKNMFNIHKHIQATSFTKLFVRGSLLNIYVRSLQSRQAVTALCNRFSATGKVFRTEVSRHDKLCFFFCLINFKTEEGVKKKKIW